MERDTLSVQVPSNPTPAPTWQGEDARTAVEMDRVTLSEAPA
jgi:hypothetical protein